MTDKCIANGLELMQFMYFYVGTWFAGVLGIKVKIMLPWDPSGKIGPKRPLPDHVSILDPKDQPAPEQPYSEQKGAKPADPAAM